MCEFPRRVPVAVKLLTKSGAQLKAAEVVVALATRTTTMARRNVDDCIVPKVSAVRWGINRILYFCILSQ